MLPSGRAWQEWVSAPPGALNSQTTCLAGLTSRQPLLKPKSTFPFGSSQASLASCSATGSSHSILPSLATMATEPPPEKPFRNRWVTGPAGGVTAGGASGAMEASGSTGGGDVDVASGVRMTTAASTGAASGAVSSAGGLASGSGRAAGAATQAAPKIITTSVACLIR